MNVFRRYQQLFAHSVPSLLALGIAEMVNVVVYLHGPVSESKIMLLLWLALQLIPGFAFAYFSDQHYRKKTLVFSQALGAIGGLVLFAFGFEVWVVVLIALTFNPLPVARAALLDNFPDQSTVKIIGVTFIAQWFPWVFFGYFRYFSINTIVVWILIAMGVGLVLTIFLFRDNYDKKADGEKAKLRYLPKRLPITLMLTAFTLSEATFYLVWDYLEYDKAIQGWLSVTTLATLCGIGISMIWSRLPHVSIITLCYCLGAVIMLITLLVCLLSRSSCGHGLLAAMSHYSVIGGVYLVFVTDSIIFLVGTRHKAFGSALIESCDTIAAFLAAIAELVVTLTGVRIMVVLLVVYIVAVAIQKIAENRIESKD